MMDPVTQFWLASDGVRLSVLGAGFWLIAAIAALMEWRRNRERPIERLEKVGWVPWMTIFLTAAFVGGGMLAVGLPALLAQR